jgi:PAS domain-containing protein
LTVQTREKEYLRKDGSRVPVLVARALFERKSDEGVSFVIDMTERKKAEEKLRASEKRHTNIFRDFLQRDTGISDYASPLELPTKFRAINRRTAESLGLTIPRTLLATATDVVGRGARPAALQRSSNQRCQPPQILGDGSKNKHPGHLVVRVVEADRASGCALSVRTASRSSCAHVATAQSFRCQ